jgi:hypothetical protein
VSPRGRSPDLSAEDLGTQSSGVNENLRKSMSHDADRTAYALPYLELPGKMATLYAT